MSTTRTFSEMLNEYLSNDLLKEEFVQRDYVLSKIDKDDGWLGGSLIVPFKAAGASSVAYGGLTSSSDVSEDKYVRGSVSTQKELWGTMLFNHRDLMEHDKISEKNFLKILPGAVEDFMDYMKNVVSVNLLNGPYFATLTADYTGTDGILTVDRPDRFVIGQKIVVKDVTAAYTVYVKSIIMDTKKVYVVTTRGGSTTDFSSGVDVIAVATAAYCYNDGADTSANVFGSLRAAFLSAANGGDATLYGQTKTTYPYLQALNILGSSITNTLSATDANGLMNTIFSALVKIRQFGRGNPTDIVMSYGLLGRCMQIIEASKGAYNVKPGSQSASQFGWTEIEVGSPTKGGIKLVGVQEAASDIIMFIDWRALKFYSNGFFRKRMSPDGDEYFEVRNTSGYQYLIDVCLFGELVVLRPSYCGIIYGIASTVPIVL